MISVVYASDAVEAFSHDELAELLTTSRRNNESRDLTGLLLYKDGQFMQVLEGEESAVTSLLELIEKDGRHSEVRTLLTETIEARRFPQWSMGFASAADMAGLAGYRDFFGHGGSADAGDPSRARLLLDWFRFHRIAPVTAPGRPSPSSGEALG